MPQDFYVIRREVVITVAAIVIATDQDDALEQAINLPEDLDLWVRTKDGPHWDRHEIEVQTLRQGLECLHT